MCFVHASQSNIFTRLAFFLDLPWLNYLVVVYKVLLFCYRYSPKIILKCHDLQHDLTGNFLCDTTFAVWVRQLHSCCLWNVLMCLLNLYISSSFSTLTFYGGTEIYFFASFFITFSQLHYLVPCSLKSKKEYC